MSDDPCDRARQAMNELCGVGLEDEDSNTFYVRTVHTQGRQVEPRDTGEMARWADDAVDEAEVTLGLSANESVEAQTINPSRNRIETYFKLPVEGMTPMEVESVLDSIESYMGDPSATVGRGFDEIKLVDRSVVADAVPEMVGPSIEDAEVF